MCVLFCLAQLYARVFSASPGETLLVLILILRRFLGCSAAGTVEPTEKEGRRPAFGDPGRRGRVVTEGNRGFPSLRRGREEDPGAGNGLDECVISVENSTFLSHEPICSAATMQRLTPGCVCPSRRDTRTAPPGPHLLFPPKLRRRRKGGG